MLISLASLAQRLHVVSDRVRDYFVESYIQAHLPEWVVLALLAGIVWLILRDVD